MDFRLLDPDLYDFRTYETGKIEVADEAIMVFVMLMRQFVLCIGLFVMAFGCVKFLHNVLDRMCRLEHNREKYGCRSKQIEYGEF